MEEYKGRVVLGGSVTGVCIVSRKPLDLEKSFQKSVNLKSQNLIANDKSDLKLYKKDLKDKVLVVKSIKNSDLAGLIFVALAKQNITPSALLVIDQIPESVLSSIFVAKNFSNTNMVVIDQIEEDFLESVDSGDVVQIEGNNIIIK